MPVRQPTWACGRYPPDELFPWALPTRSSGTPRRLGRLTLSLSHYADPLLLNLITIMSISILILIGATLFCALSTGFVYAFAVVVMPGIRTLPDRDFLRAFKVMDRIIQNSAPLFVIVWAGSIVLLIAAGIMNISTLEGMPKLLLIGAIGAYLLGFQLPTFVANVPLNNQLQAAKLDTLDVAGLQQARAAFEPRWVFWNTFRTVVGTLTTLALLIVLHSF